MERKPCHPHKDRYRNVHHTYCEREMNNNYINHGRNKQATTTQRADPCAQLISLHDIIPWEVVMQKAYQMQNLVI